LLDVAPTSCYMGNLTVSLLFRDVFFKCPDSAKALHTVPGGYLFLGIDPWILAPLRISSDVKH